MRQQQRDAARKRLARLAQGSIMSARNYHQSLVVDAATADYVGHVQPHASPRLETACRRWLRTSCYARGARCSGTARISYVHATGTIVVAASSRYLHEENENEKKVIKRERERKSPLLLFKSAVALIYLRVNRRPCNEPG